jgi:hypothetical protein
LDDRESLEEEPRSGRPCTSKTEENGTKMRTFVRSVRLLTVRMIGSELNLNHRIVHEILTEELYMQKFCVKLPKKKPHQHTKGKDKEALTLNSSKMTNFFFQTCNR